MRSKFDEQLRLLNQEMMYMGTMIEDSIQKAIEALIAQNAQLAEKIMNSDSDVDHEQKKIENICFNLLMQQQPVARDLRVISAAMKMVTDMERIGDHAADISEITIMLSKEPYVLNLDDIKKMEKSLEKLEKKLQNTSGWFKGAERDRLAGEIADKQIEISEARAGFQRIVKKYGFETVADFNKAYKAAKAADDAYNNAVRAWEAKYGEGAGKNAEPKREAPKPEEQMGVMERRLAEAKIEADRLNEERRRQREMQPQTKKRTYDMSL